MVAMSKSEIERRLQQATERMLLVRKASAEIKAQLQQENESTHATPTITPSKPLRGTE